MAGWSVRNVTVAPQTSSWCFGMSAQIQAGLRTLPKRMVHERERFKLWAFKVAFEERFHGMPLHADGEKPEHTDTGMSHPTAVPVGHAS